MKPPTLAIMKSGSIDFRLAGAIMAEFKNLDATRAYAKLERLDRPSVARLLDAARVVACGIPAGGGLDFNWAATSVDERVLEALADLAEEQELVEKYRMLAGGEIMNTGEGRMVLHTSRAASSGLPSSGRDAICALSTRASARGYRPSLATCDRVGSSALPARASRQSSR